jgi:hypothetical protein
MKKPASKPTTKPAKPTTKPAKPMVSPIKAKSAPLPGPAAGTGTLNRDAFAAPGFGTPIVRTLTPDGTGAAKPVVNAKVSRVPGGNW